MKSFFFIVRLALTWLFSLAIAFALWTSLVGRVPGALFATGLLVPLAIVVTRGFSHVRLVRLIAGRVDWSTLGNRHRLQIEIPFPPAEAFEMVDATIRELPYVETIESTRDSLQIFALVKRMDPYSRARARRGKATGGPRNQVRATVTPGDGTGSLTLICEPAGGAWLDWFRVDHGTNLENAAAISRAIARRVAERRKGEQASATQSETEKALTVAKLSLLHAQVEPHFLYNSLASAQILTRSDPAKADLMLGHLITYLRHSLPRSDDALSTLGEELERARAYLEILKIRMGPRLSVQVEVPSALGAVPLPPMMLQTLVENAIKHGLEPLTGGGTVWILARQADGNAAITVADDGRGFGGDSSGTGIGLRNVRERLRLAYGEAAAFSIVSNFPKGVAATITVPASGPAGGAHA
jgi:signal transduction histidine kinase